MPRNSSGGSSSSKRKMDMGEGFSFFGKRSKASPAPPPATTGRGRGGRSSSGGHCTADSEACLFNQKKCVAWFKEYAVAGQPDTIGPEGVESLCQDLVVDPENIAMLVLAWKMGAKQMGYFTLQEWLHGLTELQCDSLVKLRDKLDYLHSLLQDSASFKSIYRYAFDFARDKDQRSLDIETAKAMLALLLARQWALLPVFFQFLEQSRYRVLNKDQWCNVLEFSRAVDPDLTNYDVDGAWPVMLDEFVEWLKTNRNQGCPPLQ